jgi:hypothetical protein
MTVMPSRKVIIALVVLLIVVLAAAGYYISLYGQQALFP